MDFDIEIGGEPPASARGGGAGKYEPIATAARENPGKWAHVAGINRNVAGSIRQGQIKGFPKGEFEAKISGVHEVEGQYIGTLWVRYIGEGDSA